MEKVSRGLLRLGCGIIFFHRKKGRTPCYGKRYFYFFLDLIIASMIRLLISFGYGLFLISQQYLKNYFSGFQIAFWGKQSLGPFLIMDDP